MEAARCDRETEALVVIGTLTPHLRGVVRGGRVGHRVPKGLIPYIFSICTNFHSVPLRGSGSGKRGREGSGGRRGSRSRGGQGGRGELVHEEPDLGLPNMVAAVGFKPTPPKRLLKAGGGKEWRGVEGRRGRGGCGIEGGGRGDIRNVM